MQRWPIFLSWERDTFTLEGKQICSRDGAGCLSKSLWS